MKNAVIGNNKQKANLIVLGAVPRYITVKPSFCSQHALIIFKSRHAKTDTGFFSCRSLYSEKNFVLAHTAAPVISTVASRDYVHLWRSCSYIQIVFFCVRLSRLLYLLQQRTSSLELRTECAVVLGSLAMGTENNIKSLVDCHIIPALLQGWKTPLSST